MWQAVEHDPDAGTWTERARNQELATLRQEKSSPSAAKNIFYFWDAPIPADQAEQEQIVKKVMAANDGRILRVGIGVQVEVTKVDGLSSCSGSCFCVIADGKRRCETQYCNSNGYCWWVDCGMGC